MDTDRFHSFLDSAPATIAILNRSLKLVKINRAMAEAHRMSTDDYTGKNLVSVFPVLAPIVQPLLEQLLFTGKPVQLEISGEPPTYPGLTRHWLTLCFAWEESEIVFVGIELSEKKRAEQALEQVTGQLEAALAELNRAAVVSEMAHILQAARVSEEIHSIVGRYASRLFRRNPGVLCTINPSKNTVEVVATWGDPSLGESIFSPHDCWALRDGRPHVVKDPVSGLMCNHAGAVPVAQICIPMMAQTEMLGLLHLQSPATTSAAGSVFNESELQFVSSVAQEIALPLANVRLREMLMELALRDPLTGLYNRRFMQEALDREVRRSVRKHSPIGLIMLDVDRFKHLNDNYGHSAGDAVLRSVAGMLQNRMRSADVLCRYGGDEFSIMLPDASLQDTLRRAEDLLRAARLLTVESGGKILEHLTISMGVAAYPNHGSTPEALLREADSGLYMAKADGRDNVKSTISVPQVDNATGN